MKPKELVNVMYSPQWVAKLQYHALSGVHRVNNDGIKFELLYLILPFIVDDVTRVSLATKSITSSYSSIFLTNPSLDIKNSLLLKQNQIKEFKSFTNDGLIYLSNIANIEITSFVRIKNVIKFQDEDEKIKEYCKAAHVLGIVFGKEDYKTIFMNLNITSL